jgi:hypothetical protein
MTIEELHELWDKKNKGKAASSEHDLQVECLRWLRYAHPGVLCYAIPNGSYKTITTARAMRDEGLKAGMPDLHIPIARGGYHSLYIEMKNGKAGKLSEAQKEVLEILRRERNKVAICRNLEEFQEEINKYFSQ